MQLFVENGADVAAADYNELTALHLAAKNEYEAVVGLLIEKEADAEVESRGRETALHLAASNGCEVVQVLLENGGNI